MITLKNVNFSYQKEPFFQNLNLTINEEKKGKIIGIIGPNGSGKSTLMNLLMGFNKPISGQIAILGKDYQSINRLDFAKIVGHLSQDYQRSFDYLVEDYVAMGCALHQAHYYYHSENAKSMAKQYLMATNTMEYSKKSIKSLSGGEFQRVRLARVLAQNTPILILDEALSAMDIAHKKEMMEVIREEASSKEKVVLMVMHDLQLAYQCTDEVIVFHQGKLHASGPTKDILTHDLIKDTYNITTTFIENAGFIINY